MARIAVVDYGMGNLRSVEKGFAKVGHEVLVTNRPEDVAAAEKVVLPGVGAFRDAIAEIKRLNLDEPLRESVQRGRPFLGICLGMQLIFDVSYEDGEYQGLHILPGKVVLFQVPHEYKVPHMGWNELQIVRPAPVLRGLKDGTHVYFVHSYHCVPDNPLDVAATADYPEPFAAVVWRENLCATQFHPEKSQADGLQILKNFVEW